MVDDLCSNNAEWQERGDSSYLAMVEESIDERDCKKFVGLNSEMKSTEVLNPQRSAFDGRRHVCTHNLHGLMYCTVGI